MSDARVVLIGGTSHTGKSTVARALADRLGFAHLSTDGLARHPGRPWPTPQWQVPDHVDQHYRELPVDELIDSVLGHYQRLWPRIEELITARAAAANAPGSVLEGSALWPAHVARLTVPGTAAVWLTAAPDALTARLRASSDHDRRSAHDRVVIDRFLARTLRYQELMIEACTRLALPRVDTTAARPLDELLDAVLGAASRRGGTGLRSASGPSGNTG